MFEWQITEFTSEQLAQQRSAEQVMLGLRNSQYEWSRNNFVWKWGTCNGQACLISDGKNQETTLNHGNGVDLDLIFQRQKEKHEQAAFNLDKSTKEYKEAVSINRYLDIGSAEPTAVQIVNALQAHGVLQFHRVIGTHALFAYESDAGIRFADKDTSTRDIDMLWNKERRIDFRKVLNNVMPEMSMIEVLKTVDPTFRRSDENSESAVNDDQFSVDFLRLEGVASENGK